MLLCVLHGSDGLRMKSANTLKLTLRLLDTRLSLLHFASPPIHLVLRTLEPSLLDALLVLRLLERLSIFRTLLRQASRVLLGPSLVGRSSSLRPLLFDPIALGATLGGAAALLRRGYRATQEAEPDRPSLMGESAGGERGAGVLIHRDGVERLLGLLEGRLARRIPCTVKQPVSLVEQGEDRLSLAISRLPQVVRLALPLKKLFVCLTEDLA